MPFTTIIKQATFLLISILILGGCNEQECVLPDYGVEEGFEWMSPPQFGDSIITEPIKLPLWRDRNHLDIRFYNWVGRERAEEILEKYGFVNRFPQSFEDLLVTGNFVRVSQEPAEVYYTTYGDITHPVLGNMTDVEYALPAFFLT